MKLLKSLRNALLAIQLLSLALTGVFLVLPVSLFLGVNDLTSAGSTLTLVFLLTTITCHLRARKASFHLGLLALLGVFGPAYALLGGPLRYIGGYHLASLGAHFMIYIVLRNRLVGQAQGPDQG